MRIILEKERKITTMDLKDYHELLEAARKLHYRNGYNILEIENKFIRRLANGLIRGINWLVKIDGKYLVSKQRKDAIKAVEGFRLIKDSIQRGCKIYLSNSQVFTKNNKN